jgi:hypothetical protein
VRGSDPRGISDVKSAYTSDPCGMLVCGLAVTSPVLAIYAAFEEGNGASGTMPLASYSAPSAISTRDTTNR